jgi:hypothetical protein
MRRDCDTILGIAEFRQSSWIGQTPLEHYWRYLRREWNREPILDVPVLLGSRFHPRLRSDFCFEPFGIHSSLHGLCYQIIGMTYVTLVADSTYESWQANDCNLLDALVDYDSGTLGVQSTSNGSVLQASNPITKRSTAAGLARVSKWIRSRFRRP